MVSRRKFPYIFPAVFIPNDFFGQNIWLTLALIALLLWLCFFVLYKKKQQTTAKPQNMSKDVILRILNTGFEKNAPIRASFESLQGKSHRNWEIQAMITEIKPQSLILKTNLTREVPTDEIDHSKVYFTPSNMKQNIVASIGIMYEHSYVNYTFTTNCKKHIEKDDAIYLEIDIPTNLEEGQRRAFPRVSISKDLLYTFAVWPLPKANVLPFEINTLGEPFYSYRHEEDAQAAILNISANGLALVLKDELNDEKNLQLLQKGTCLLLLSLVQQFEDDVLNLWLTVEVKHETGFDYGTALGCEIKSWAEHPTSSKDLKWQSLNEREEVPALLTWVVEELAYGNHEKALQGLTRNISLPEVAD